MSHSIPIQLNGGTETTPAPVAAPPVVPFPTLAPKPTTPRPTYANYAGEEWSTRELQLVEQAFRTSGYEAAYKVVPHRSKPAVRGRLQRAGLIPSRPVTTL